MSNIAATYMPDIQVMTLKSQFDAFANPENLTGFTTPEQVAIFFHEWIHYLHNISTVLGLTTFCNLTIVWSNFRRTFGEDGWSHGDALIGPDHSQDIIRQYGYMQELRGKRHSTLPKDISPEDVRIKSVKAVEVNPSDPNGLRYLECEVECFCSDFVEHKLFVGTNELLEYAAFSLEERAATAMGTVLTRPVFNPYLIVPAIARLLAPNLIEEDVLKATLASLQSPQPPLTLLFLLAHVNEEKHAGKDAGRVIHDAGIRLLNNYLPSAEESLRMLEEMFPIDEVMARVVKETVARLRVNLMRRQQNLFFEFDVVEHLRTNITSLNEVIRLYGAPVLIQERPGHEDEIGRDLIYEFSQKDAPKGEFSEGWRLMHAAHRFVNAHLRTGKLQPTSEATFLKCPFYTSCHHNYRKEHSEDCRQQPWRAAINENNVCDYAVAVRITRPSTQKESIGHSA